MAHSRAAYTDELLLQAFAKGDETAFGELAERYEPSLLGFAAGVLHGKREAAMDAVQETWIRVIRFAGKFDARSSFKTWLYRILINQCHSMQGNLQRGSGAIHPSSPDANISQLIDDAPLDSEDRMSLAAAVERLPQAKRSILLLCYHRGMTHEQAAQILEIPLGTLKSRLHSALNELRSIMNTTDSEIAHEQRA